VNSGSIKSAAGRTTVVIADRSLNAGSD